MKKILISLAAFDLKQWLKDRVKNQTDWKRKSPSYKTVIERLLSIKGDFVLIPKNGDPAIDIIAKKGRRSRAPIKSIGRQGDARSKLFVIKYVLKDPDRYRMCIGYGLTEEREISFWSKHYWIFDTKEKTIVEVTIAKKVIYFGVTLSRASSLRLAESNKGI